MNIKQRLNKEPLPYKENVPEPEQTFDLENAVMELLTQVPITYDVVSTVIDRKYPFEELMIEDFDAISVILHNKELKRRSYKLGFNKKVDGICQKLPSIVESLIQCPKDYLLLNGLRVVETDKKYVGSDYNENTILYSMVDGSVLVAILDRVEIPFLYEVTNTQPSKPKLSVTEDLTEVAEEDLGLDEEPSDSQNELFKRLVESTKTFIEEDDVLETENTPKISSKDVNLDVLSLDEQKKLESEILAQLEQLD